MQTPLKKPRRPDEEFSSPRELNPPSTSCTDPNQYVTRFWDSGMLACQADEVSRSA